MSGRAVVAAAAVSLAALALMTGGGARTQRRIQTVLPAGPRPAAPRRGRRAAAIPTVAALAGVAVVLFVGGLSGVVVGVAATVALDRGLRRLEPRAERERRATVLAALPFTADLLAAVVSSGAPIWRAVGQVADAVGGPLGERLRQVARVGALGAPPAEAWSALADLPEAAPLVRAAVRANDSGAALAGACGRLAAELRIAEYTASETAARRAGVLVVLPLGCCFLPAFVLLGVVPVVIGVLHDVLR